MGIKNNTKINF